MTAEATPIRTEQVIAADGAVHIVELTETDDTVVRFIGDADDSVDATRRCLRVGAQALTAATVRVDVDVVERAFGDLEARFDQRLTETVGAITATSSELFNEDDGAVPGALADFRAQLVETLGDHFDPTSKQSAVAKIEDAVRNQLEVAGDTMRKIVRTEMVDELRKEIRVIAEGLSIAEATKDAYERTAAKGFDFEDEVHDALAEVAAVHGDLVEQTGDEKGCTGRKIGDEVVTLNPVDTAGVEARIVFEVKDRSLPMRRIRDELDSAMENRDALVGVAVFSSQDNAPTKLPFQHFDDHAIVVFDRDECDTQALRLAYLWARIEVRRRVAVDRGDVLDVDRLVGLLQRGSTALERVTTIKRRHSEAKKAIEFAVTEVGDMVDEVRAVLDELEGAVGDAA